MSTKIQKQLLKDFPEIEHVVTKMGSAEVPTDPMPMEVGDVMVKMKPKSEWQYQTKEEMFNAMRKSLSVIPGVQYEFTQPIQMRFNELISGAREDIAVKIYGEDLTELSEKGLKAEKIIRQLSGVGDVKVEQVTGLPQIVIDYNRQKIAQYGVSITSLNKAIETAFAGGVAGVVFEGERRFDLVVRLEESKRNNINDIKDLLIPISEEVQVPLKELANIGYKKAPMQISREDSKRRITVGVNADGIDVETLVNNIDEKLKAELDLKSGYYIEYGGQFENLKEASNRLAVAVPIALLLIIVLLYFTFNSIKQSLLIFTAIPLSAIGGVYALYIREMPFSISAGIGFIALFGVAVLNGIVLIGYFNQLKEEGMDNVMDRIIEGTKVRLRPVLMTALVAALGFLPMAISTSAGGEVQKPLATVVIGGLLSATILTLFILPILYSWSEKIKTPKVSNKGLIILFFLGAISVNNRVTSQTGISIEEAVELAKANHPSMKVADLKIEQQKALNKSNFKIDKTAIDYSRGQINSIENDYQLTISQSFKFPTYYSKTKSLNSENIASVLLAKSITENNLELEVRSLYVTLLGLKDELNNANEQLGFYNEYYSIAQKRQEVGESTVLETNSIAVKRFKVQSELKNIEQEYEIQIKQLGLLIGEEGELEIEELKNFQIPFNFSDTSFSNAPLVITAEQKFELTGKQVQLQKAQALPDFSLGYFNQQIDGSQGFDGFNVGLKVPLFYWSEKGALQAAKINQEIAGEEIELNKIKLNQFLANEVQTIEKLNNSIQYIQTEGIPLVQKLVISNQRSLREGEVNYIMYLSALKDYNSIHLEYIHLLKEYNQTVLRTQALLGAF